MGRKLDLRPLLEAHSQGPSFKSSRLGPLGSKSLHAESVISPHDFRLNCSPPSLATSLSLTVVRVLPNVNRSVGGIYHHVIHPSLSGARCQILYGHCGFNQWDKVELEQSPGFNIRAVRISLKGASLHNVNGALGFGR